MAGGSVSSQVTKAPAAKAARNATVNSDQAKAGAGPNQRRRGAAAGRAARGTAAVERRPVAPGERGW
jgi:hypothetical protein